MFSLASWVLGSTRTRQSRVTNEGFKIRRCSMGYVPCIFGECWGRREMAQFVLRIWVTITR